MQNTVLPSKYSKLYPSFLFAFGSFCFAFRSAGVNWGDDATESSFSPPCIRLFEPFWLDSFLVGKRKLDLKERGDLSGVCWFPPFR
jgi:hypothetical protein